MPVEKNGSNWIQSYTGQRIDLLRPDPSVINIEDIAHALSRLCRYTGHTKRHLSVAEHSVWVSRRAVERFDRDRASLYSPQWAAVIRKHIARQGLLHDATEAYLGDVSRPLKHLPGMREYRQLESEWARAIADTFGTHVYGPEVGEADAEILGEEARQLLKGGPREDWPDLPASLHGHPRMGMSAWRAKWMFMREYRRLWNSK